MNQDTDREMDFLLRRQGRRGASGMSGAKDANGKVAASLASSAAGHLDADEMSVYAEGALSESTRSRYAAHLADCDQCRRVVTGLVLASGTEAEESPAVAQRVTAPARSWRDWLGAIFSPPVLRYAAPALALVAFAAIVLVVVTRNRDGQLSVARNEQSQQQSPVTGAEAEKGDANSTTATAPASPAGQSQPSAANANSAGPGQGAASLPSPESKDVQTAAAPPPPIQVDGTTPSDTVRTANDPRNETPAPQARPSETRDATQQKSETSADTLTDRAKERDDESLSAKKAREEAATTGGGRAAGTATSSGTAAASPGALGASSDSAGTGKNKSAGPKSVPLTASRRARQETSGADDERQGAATRTVAGKSFRQQNGVWVDTAYNSSRSTTRVKRGTEQYRALVADEPVIGTVANSLGGACIIVIRNRAYYIY